MSDRKRPTNIGGQAVIEGVMMRGKKIYAMAVRNPEGEIVVEKKPVGGLGKKGLFRYPIFRGMAAFVDSLVTGTKILMRSAEIAGEGWEEEELSPFEQWLKEKLGDKINDILIYFSVFISLLLGMGLFFVLPVAIGNLFKTLVPTWALGIIEGLIRRYRANIPLMLELITFLTEECCSGHPEKCISLYSNPSCSSTEPLSPTWIKCED